MLEMELVFAGDAMKIFAAFFVLFFLSACAARSPSSRLPPCYAPVMNPQEGYSEQYTDDSESGEDAFNETADGNDMWNEESREWLEDHCYWR
ncbi:MAG: hypothetical protein HYT22_02480 [Candidatus Niyogibacteria bacterium]|nr:hypothetical protein [Candidatus Niyogibacteria bacterium]